MDERGGGVRIGDLSELLWRNLIFSIPSLDQHRAATSSTAEQHSRNHAHTPRAAE